MGLSFGSLLRSRHNHQLREVPSFSFSEALLSRHDNRESDFEGFPDAGTSAETSITDRRISVLQAARRCLLEERVGLAFLSLPSCSQGLLLYEVPPAAVAGSLGLPG